MTRYRLAWYEEGMVKYDTLNPWTTFRSVVAGAVERLNKLYPDMKYFVDEETDGEKNEGGHSQQGIPPPRPV